MLEFITTTENFPFTFALALMLVIALLEGVATLLGAGVSHAIDALLPDFNLEIDVPDLDAASPDALSKLLSWVRIGRVPALMLLVIFLASFGLSGFALQSFWQNLNGNFLPSYIASIPALVVTLPSLRFLGGALAKLLPQTETAAIAEDSLIGRIATITLGEAKTGSPAEAKLIDKYDTTHYVMVEPDIDKDSFKKGDSVLLVKRQGATFSVIASQSKTLAGD